MRHHKSGPQVGRALRAAIFAADSKPGGIDFHANLAHDVKQALDLLKSTAEIEETVFV